jgi:phage terminase large subunit-like protein
LAGALLFGERTIICSAHEQKTSRVLFRNLESYFSSFNDLRRRVLSVGSALGREEIRLRNGTVLFFPARTRSTLRGWSIDCYLADEAQLLTDQQWESAKPAMAARPNAAVWLFGTAPQMSTDAEVFGRLRASAHNGAEDLAWVEYGADPGADLDDRDQWTQANPGRVTIEAIEGRTARVIPGRVRPGTA